MLPEAGAFELMFLAAVALIVVGPKDLPVLLRKLGQFTAKMRGLAAEFRSSFDEMARQSELDELRKEVEALRTGGLGHAGAAKTELESHVRDIEGHMAGYSEPEPYRWTPPAEPTVNLAVTDDGDATPELPFPDAPHPAQTQAEAHPAPEPRPEPEPEPVPIAKAS